MCSPEPTDSVPGVSRTLRGSRRPHVALAVAAVAVVSLSGCATFTRNDAAARVDDVTLSRDALGAMLDSDLAGQLLGVQARGGLADGNAARSLVAAWILLTAIDQAGLAEGADLAGVEAALAGQFGDLWLAAPQEMRDLAVLNGAVSTLVNEGRLDQDAAVDALNGADVYLDSRYGVWRPDTISIAPLG